MLGLKYYTNPFITKYSTDFKIKKNMMFLLHHMKTIQKLRIFNLNDKHKGLKLRLKIN